MRQLESTEKTVNEFFTQSDEQLVLAAQNGSSEAFDTLYRIYSKRLFRTIVSITRNWQDAQDALQDTFLRAYSSLCEFEGRATVYSWLTRTAINSALMILRKRRGRPEMLVHDLDEPNDGPHLEIADPVANPEQACQHRQHLGRVMLVIEKLQPLLRIPIQIHIMHESSIKEIGRALDVSDAAVKSRLYRVRQRLSALLDSRRPKGKAEQTGLRSSAARSLPAATVRSSGKC
jgi:RNA polymerase sigma-70 factor (ECF subfamily)